MLALRISASDPEQTLSRRALLCGVAVSSRTEHRVEATRSPPARRMCSRPYPLARIAKCIDVSRCGLHGLSCSILPLESLYLNASLL